MVLMMGMIVNLVMNPLLLKTSLLFLPDGKTVEVIEGFGDGPVLRKVVELVSWIQRKKKEALLDLEVAFSFFLSLDVDALFLQLGSLVSFPEGLNQVNFVSEELVVVSKLTDHVTVQLMAMIK